MQPVFISKEYIPIRNIVQYLHDNGFVVNHKLIQKLLATHDSVAESDIFCDFHVVEVAENQYQCALESGTKHIQGVISGWLKHIDWVDARGEKKESIGRWPVARGLIHESQFEFATCIGETKMKRVSRELTELVGRSVDVIVENATRCMYSDNRNFHANVMCDSAEYPEISAQVFEILSKRFALVTPLSITGEVETPKITKLGKNVKGAEVKTKS